MIAIKRLQSIMWILIVAVGALSAYLISLRVATERNAVSAIERQIYATRSNIRYLEVEFSARSTMRQLAEWNARDIRYAVPAAGQYLVSEQQLAALDLLPPAEMPVGAPPVMAAVAQAEPAPAPAAMPVAATVALPVPAMAIPVKADAPPRRDEPPAFALVRTAAAAEPSRSRPALATVKAASEPRIVKLVDRVDPGKRRAMRLALLEETLLDSKTLSRMDRAESGKAGR